MTSLITKFLFAIAAASLMACAEGSIDSSNSDQPDLGRYEPDAGPSDPDVRAPDAESEHDSGCTPGPELCNGVDDDCDGVVDNATTDTGETCQSGTGACASSGVTTCDDGEIVCAAQPGDVQTELCGNGIDDDCDGEIDEGYADVGQPCSIGEGTCASDGTTICSDDGLGTTCDAPVIQPETELCGNGADDDCDGEIDEGFDVGDSCTTGVGACEASGVKVCSPDQTSTVCDAVAADPTSELCGNGADDDCDGTIDEGFELLGMACSTGTGACAATGTYSCSTNALDLTCDASPGSPVTELCGNGVDDDCDGDVDEGFPDLGTVCTDSLNSCTATGNIVCDGTSTRCDAVVTPTAETCDGTDEDCDGDIDDDEICGACADDPFEINDFASGAAGLPADSRHQLVSCFTDVDWYTLSGVTAGQTLVINSTFEDLRADLDLRLLDPSGTTVAGSTSGTDDEQIVHTAQSTGEYLLEVRQFGPKAVQDYTVHWTTFASPPACTDDAWEPTNDIATAPPLSLGRSVDAEICAGDIDYYDLGTVTRSFGLRVTLTHIAANGDLDVRLLRYGSEVAAAETSADDESIVFWPDFGGDLTLVVEGSDAAVANDYTLMVEFAGPFACASDGTDVVNEPDNSVPEATALTANSGRNAAICGDDDWIRLPSIQAGDELTASLFFDHAIGDLDLWIFPDLGPSGTYDASTALTASRSSTNDEHVRGVMPGAGDYYARIEGFGGDRARYRFVWDVVSHTCDDAFEPNNRFASFPSLAYKTSARLSPDTTYTANLCSGDLDNFELGQLGVGKQVEVTVSADVGDFEIELYDGLTSVASDAGTGLTKTITYTTTDDDEHTLAVRPLNAAAVAYSVSYEVL